MENRAMNHERWVEERLRALDPGNDWRPNAGAALAGLRHRDQRRRSWQRGWIWSTAMASVGAVVMIALPAPAKCALARVGCARLSAIPVLPVSPLAAKPAPPEVAATPALRHAVQVAKSSATAPVLNYPVVLNYKESGSPNAPVVCEIYSDYECPWCARFYTGVFPQFVAEFVKTGKVRVVHRDFPLPQHRFSQLAARYANAAGETGHYDEVVNQLFASQSEWAENGNVDAAVAHALPPETMRQVRALVESDPRLEATVADDLAIIERERIKQVPTIVFIYKGTRRTVAGPPSFSLLRSYLEEMLAQ
jgi:protein-disulfide isomerase